MATEIRVALPRDGRFCKGFTDPCGKICLVQEEDCQEEPAILFVLYDVNASIKMHFNKEQAAELLPLLQRFIETGRLQNDETI